MLHGLAILVSVAGVSAACDTHKLARHYNRTLHCAHTRDMCQYSALLRRLASHGDSVVEMGVRGIVSSWALLMGLHDSAASNKWLLSIDIANINFALPTQIGTDCGIDVRFVRHDSATVRLPPAYDLLFIDTMHAYPHLTRELRAHANRTRHYIVMHDTEIDGEHSDVLRMGGEKAIAPRAVASGYRASEVRMGLKPAINEFLEQRPEWTVLEHFAHTPGLTVLVRHATIAPGGRAFFRTLPLTLRWRREEWRTTAE